MINLCKRGHHALLSSMDDDNGRGWMEWTWLNPSDLFTELDLPAGSVAIPEEDILADPADAARLLQEALTLTITPTEDDVSALWGEYDLVKYANCRFRDPIAATGAAGLSTRSLPSLVGEHQTTSTTFDAAASHSSTPSASSPPSPIPATATSFPSAPILPLAIATPSPSATPDHEEGVPLPQSPVHGNLGQNYAAPSEDPQRRRNITLSANFIASEGLQRAAEAVVLEARLQQSKQEVITLSQEIGPLRVRYDEAKAKWAEVQNDVLAATDREASSAERVINLEAALNSKSEELAIVEAKHAQLEEKYRKTTEHSRLFRSTIRQLAVSLQSARSARKNLSAEVTQLKEELKHRSASLIVEKPYSMYSMRRKTLEEAKDGIIDVDAKIAKARELELAAKNRLPTQSDAPGSSDFGSEFSETEEGSEGDEAEDQTGGKH
ncbi:uncharacterized protein [Nicotiana tomentosiformis]|uniref:uncharacterized protein n=1 Tax=Nicotiana tomentosiformis TaxID=4098 RepID=UPI00388CB20F